MTGIRLLDCPIQPYAWGSRNAIAQIQGRGVPSNGPEAELWIGDHPKAPCRVRTRPEDERTTELRPFLHEHPDWLGPRDTLDSGEPRLPFLLKILAADAPLSLQVHPTAARAREAFVADHPAYVDDQPKPEILCALTPFRAMVGFRPFEESAELLRALRSKLPPDSTAAPPLEGFLTRPCPLTLRDLLAGLHRMSRGAARDLIQALRQLDLRQAGEASPESLAVSDLLTHYPTDPLCIAPLLLQVLTLQPGEAIHTEAGILHSYLGGAGVELMTTSDNVLRAGLTEKPVHLHELLEVTRFEPTPPGHAARTARVGDPFEYFATPSPSFELATLHWAKDEAAARPSEPGVQVLLCTEGRFEIAGPGEHGEQVAVDSGQAALIGANWGPYRIQGRGQLFRATVPEEAIDRGDSN